MPRADDGPRLAEANLDDSVLFLRARLMGVTLWTGIFTIGFAATNPLFEARREGLRALSHLLQGCKDPRLWVGALLVVLSLVADRLPLRRRALEWLDVAITLVTCAGYDSLLFASLPGDRLELTLVLSFSNFLLVRAAIVPSTGRRTALVGAVAVMPLVATTYAAYQATGTADVAWSSAVTVAQWGAVAVTSSWLLSNRLYAMQRRIDAAERFGQYALEEKIGEGGMGQVFRARHALLRRPTALKLLPRSRAGAQAIARFEREVQMTSRLTHPSTIQIYDFGRADDGTFYYAMELIEGLTLEQLVNEAGAQPPGRVARILADVCGSLAEAHAAGLVHRDIKPQNVMLCARGGSYDVVKVLDFGLAKTADDLRGESGAVAGTPAYMAPEAIARPERLGPASDLYAVGALGYFLLTGAPVFAGKSAFELFGQHLHAAPVPPGERCERAIPPALERLVLACLAKSPNERPESAEALRTLLVETGLAAGWSDSDAAAWWRSRATARPADAPEDARSDRAVLSRPFRVTRA